MDSRTWVRRPTRLDLACRALAVAAIVLSCRCRPRPQASQAHQIVGRADEVGDMLCAHDAGECRQRPFEDPVHPFADPLTE